MKFGEKRKKMCRRRRARRLLSAPWNPICVLSRRAAEFRPLRNLLIRNLVLIQTGKVKQGIKRLPKLISLVTLARKNQSSKPPDPFLKMSCLRPVLKCGKPWFLSSVSSSAPQFFGSWDIMLFFRGYFKKSTNNESVRIIEYTNSLFDDSSNYGKSTHRKI